MFIKTMKMQLGYDSQTFLLDLTPTGKAYTASLNGETYSVELLHRENGRLDLRLIRLPASESAPASVFTAQVSADGPRLWVTVGGQTFVLTKATGAGKRGGHSAHAAGELVAPMPGQVRAVQVAEGESVTKGQTLLIVEAMKMEIKIAAPRDGVVKSLKVKPGQPVEKDQLLIEIETGK